MDIKFKLKKIFIELRDKRHKKATVSYIRETRAADGRQLSVESDSAGEVTLYNHSDECLYVAALAIESNLKVGHAQVVTITAGRKSITLNMEE